MEKPARTAPTPTTPCAYVGTYDDRPINTAPMEVAAMLAETRIRRLNTHGGRIGSAADRSTNANMTIRTAAARNSPMLIGEDHAHATPPSSSARIARDSPAVRTATPS